MRDTYFYQSLATHVQALGGYHNAHLHLDRSYTYRGESTAHLTLPQKHRLISSIHGGDFYQASNLESRLQTAILGMVKAGTRRADSVIDTTKDGVGLSALQVARKVAQDNAGDIDVRIGAYSPLGFKAGDDAAWDLLEQGARIADFIGALPEKDDVADYPDHIGYAESCERMIDLAYRSNTFVQIHTDQMNSASENGTEVLLDVLEARNPFDADEPEPQVWAVHMISPSAYDEARWNRLVARLAEARVGVICCPSGALGMRQLRHERAPTHNSIARVLDLCAAGVVVRLGNDNCGDMLSPSTTVDLTDEVFVLSAALRFYDTEVLAHLACGLALPGDLQTRVAHMIADDHA